MNQKELKRLTRLHEKAIEKVKDIAQQIVDLKGTETIQCGVCNAEPMIKDCVFIDKMHFSRGGAYEDDSWDAIKGHGQCLCGSCGAHLSFPYLADVIKLKEYFGLRVSYYPVDGYSHAKGEFTIGWRDTRKEFMSAADLFKYFKSLKK